MMTTRLLARRRIQPFAAALAMLLTSGCAMTAPPATPSAATPLPPLARYVAMGSSFAAGPGITPITEGTPARCTRSQHNYPQELARARQLDLVDVSCSGATTAHILGPWNELPPQIDAVTPDTRLVTITIGGNDVGFVGALMAASCSDGPGVTRSEQAAMMCREMAAYRQRAEAAARATATSPTANQPASATDEASWAGLEANLRRIVTTIRQRAPQARIIFVDYVTMVGDGALCPEVPLSGSDAAQARTTATRLARLTEAVALSERAEVLKASDLSAAHTPCDAQPWSTGLYPAPGQTQGAPYHPNAAGMRGIADALAARLAR